MSLGPEHHLTAFMETLKALQERVRVLEEENRKLRHTNNGLVRDLRQMCTSHEVLQEVVEGYRRSRSPRRRAPAPPNSAQPPQSPPTSEHDLPIEALTVPPAEAVTTPPRSSRESSDMFAQVNLQHARQHLTPVPVGWSDATTPPAAPPASDEFPSRHTPPARRVVTRATPPQAAILKRPPDS